jgi:outer membrane immunogenic protein
MKKLLLILGISLVFTAASHAQVRVGAMLGYGSEVEQWGLGLNGEFIFNEKMAIAPSLLFYFPETTSGFKYSYWELNGNFHYYFLQEDVVSLYGLAGLNLTTVKVKRKNDFLDGTDHSNSEAGLNIGIGANFHVGSVIPYTELKYVAGDYDQAVLYLGVKFPLSE